MEIVRSNGILVKSNKLWTAQVIGMAGFRKQPLMIQILEDKNGKATFAVGDERLSFVVESDYVEELINTYKRDRENDKTN